MPPWFGNIVRQTGLTFDKYVDGMMIELEIMDEWIMMLIFLRWNTILADHSCSRACKECLPKIRNLSMKREEENQRKIGLKTFHD